MVDTCPDCGEQYKGVALHIVKSSCSWPDLSTVEWSLLRGLVLGDGCIEPNGRIKVETTQEEFVRWLDNNFPFLISRVYKYRTAKENAKHSYNHNNLDVSDDPSDYQATYIAAFKVRPETKEMRERWYDNGKRVPDDISLTPMMAKMWYAGDGHLQTDVRPRICTRSEYKEKEKEKRLFEDAGFDVYDNGYHYFSIPKQSLFEWMGKPPAGFEYKWPDERVK